MRPRLRSRQLLLAFLRKEDAGNIRRLLTGRGYEVAGVCASGSQALALAEELGECVVVCGFRLGDMIYRELAEDLPGGSTMLLIANPARVDELPDQVVFLPTPLRTQELFSTVELLVQGITPGRHSRRGSRAPRPREDRIVIDRAKALLMERHRMTEPEAHRYLQKRAMENGCDLVETAQMLLAMG